MSKLRRKKIHKKILMNLHPNEDAMVIGQIIALEKHIRNMKQGDQSSCRLSVEQDFAQTLAKFGFWHEK